MRVLWYIQYKTAAASISQPPWHFGSEVCGTVVALSGDAPRCIAPCWCQVRRTVSVLTMRVVMVGSRSISLRVGVFALAFVYVCDESPLFWSPRFRHVGPF